MVDEEAAETVADASVEIAKINADRDVKVARIDLERWQAQQEAANQALRGEVAGLRETVEALSRPAVVVEEVEAEPEVAPEPEIPVEAIEAPEPDADDGPREPAKAKARSAWGY